jgi:hypothetical protein
MKLKLMVYPKEITEKIKSGEIKDARDVSWLILQQKWECIQDTEHGDSANNNLGLKILEEALDWRIGLLVLNLMGRVSKGKRLKPFSLQIGKCGSLTGIFADGREIIFEK